MRDIGRSAPARLEPSWTNLARCVHPRPIQRDISRALWGQYSMTWHARLGAQYNTEWCTRARRTLDKYSMVRLVTGCFGRTGT